VSKGIEEAFPSVIHSNFNLEKKKDVGSHCG
jgi:hypothetical protein